MTRTKALIKSALRIFLGFSLVITLFVKIQPAHAKRPPEIRNQEDLNISDEY